MSAIRKIVFFNMSVSADYQVFSLGENGPETAFLKQLVSKVFIQSDENPFYLACSSCSNCPVAARCPVRHNYEFLSNQAVPGLP